MNKFLTILAMAAMLAIPAAATTKKQCKKPTPKPPVTKPTSSDSSAASSSSSSANAGASATGGNATATGGSAQQSQGQQQTQNNDQQQSNNQSATTGDQQQSTSYSSSYTQVRQAPMAYAPDALPSAPCRVSGSAGVSAPIGGLSLGGSKLDGECDLRESARAFALIGNRNAAAKILCETKAAKKAHLTAADCGALESEPVPPAPASPVSIVLPSQPAASPAIAAVAPAPIHPADYDTTLTVTPDEQRLLGVCTFAKAISCQPDSGPAVITISTICKQMLEAARRELQTNPNAILYIVGNRNTSEDRLTATSRANNVRRYLVQNGVKESRVNVKVGDGTSRTVELWLDSTAK